MLASLEVRGTASINETAPEKVPCLVPGKPLRRHSNDHVRTRLKSFRPKPKARKSPNLTIHHLEIANLNHLHHTADSVYKDSVEYLLLHSTITMAPASFKGDFSSQRFPSSSQGQQLSTRLPLSRRMDLSSWLDAACLATGAPRNEQPMDPKAILEAALALIEGDAIFFPSNTGESPFSQ
jgi:hypothetical protein